MPRLRTLALLLLLLSSRLVLAADLEKATLSSRWVAVEESGGIVYFVSATPARIQRYDLKAAAWLSDITLSEKPTAFAVDQDRLYISFGRRTSRFALNGSGEVHLKNTPSDASVLFVIGNHLIIGSYSSFWSLNKVTGVEVDAEDSFYAFAGIDVAPNLRRAFGRSTGRSPSDIFSMALNADGTFGEIDESPYHGDYPDAIQTWVFPGEARVADDSGVVYNTGDLTYSNSLGGPFDDLTFYGDLPIVLRGGEVISYSNALLETGRYRPAQPPIRIFIRGKQVFSFYQGADRIEAEQFSIDLLEPAEPGEPVDPNGLAYVPDSVALGKDGVVYLLSRSNLSIFRWSISRRRYLETIPLLAAPDFMAYSAKTNRLYLAYPAGALHQIRLDTGISEAPFANSPQTTCGLSTAGEYLFVCDLSGAWRTHYTYAPDGTLVSQRDWNYYSEEYVWSEANRRMYFFRDDTGPNDIHWEEIAADGSLGAEGESPYHGEVRTLHPIRVAPDASIVLLGSGEIYDARTIERRDSLSNDINDATWIQGTLFTLRDHEGAAELQKWGAGYAITARHRLAGTSLRLLGYGSQLLAVTSVAGIPHFSLWDTALNEVASTLPLTLAGGRFSVRAFWRTPDGANGEGRAVQLTADTGYFWFFDPNNVEMIVKVLDACSLSRRFWTFAGGLTDVEVEVSVVDNQTGQTRTYLNPQGTPFQPIQDTNAFRNCPVTASAASAASATGVDGITSMAGKAAAPLLLNNGRFRVEIGWRTPDGQSGTGQGVSLTPDTGYFWFFAPSNAEVVAKVLDGCAVNGRFWVFAGGLTNVETEIRVTDTVTSQVRTYTSPQGQAFQPLQDTNAFRCQ